MVLPNILTTVTGNLFCSGAGVNWSINAISALSLNSVAASTSALTTLQGFVISDYFNLTQISFPNLTTVGSNVILARNPLVKAIDGLKALSQINGNLDLTGNFDVLDLTGLKSVSGSINIQTTSMSFACPDFGNVTVKGKISCSGNVANPQPLTNDNSLTVPLNITSTAVVPTPTAMATGGSPSSTNTPVSSANSISRDGAAPWKASLILGSIMFTSYLIMVCFGGVVYLS